MSSKRVTFIEIEIKKCSNTYGVAPCVAAVGVTGSEKCFNCRATCQDLDNIVEADEVVRFSIPSSNIRTDLDATPNVTTPSVAGVSYTPGTLNLGGGLGTRAALTISFKDHASPDTDASGDQYIGDRTYDPYTLGSYWGKFRARYPYNRGQLVRWIQGDADQNIVDMETRTFVLDEMAGPNVSGAVTITAKDILKLADGDQSVAPFVDTETSVTTFNASYLGAIDSVADTTPLGSSAGYLVINGTEIAAYSLGFAGPGVQLINLTARGEFGTEAVDNSTGDEVNLQKVLEYGSQSPADIMFDLLTVYAGVPASFIPLADWQTEATTYINRNYSANVARPTSVSQLLTELIEQTASSMWWDNENQLIRWQVLKEPVIGAVSYSDVVTDRGSFNVKDNYLARVSRCFVYFGQRNPLLNLDETSNYTSTVLREERESEKSFNDVPAYKQIFSRWITAPARDTAERLGDLILQRFSFPPRKVGFRLMRNAALTPPELAGSYSVASYSLQTATGAPESIPVQVTGLNPSATTYTVEAEEVTFNSVLTPEDPNVFPLSIDSNDSNINLRDLYDLAGGPGPFSGLTVNVTIAQSATVSSTDTGTEALAVLSGDWPVGVTINIVNNGRIVGKGGRGGDSPVWDYLLLATSMSGTAKGIAGTDGGDGGDAILATYPVNLTNNGTIGGGGGGGGGGSAMRAYVRFLNLSSTPSANRPRVSYWVYSGGGAGGGGAGSGAGGDVVAIRSIAENVNGIPPDSYVSPLAAQGGGVTSFGAGSPFGYASHFIDWGSPSQPASGPLREIVNAVGTGGIGGDGGGLGVAGSNGSGFIVAPVVGTYNGGAFDEYSVLANASNALSGGADPVATSGGAAGDAIVGSVTLTNNGDIFGAVVP